MQSNAVGADGISRKIMMNTLPALSDCLLTMMNKSFDDCIFPMNWKRAVIAPVAKVSSPKSPTDYRPIALLPFLAKVLERLEFNQLSSYLHEDSQLDPRQCGFRSDHSTQTALLRLINDVRRNVDNHKITVLGSILGPLLFSLFVNEIGRKIVNSRYLFYADDLQIYCGCDPTELHHCFEQLNADISRIHDWALANGLQLNVSKTTAIVFGARRYINAVDMTSLRHLGCVGTAIEFVSSVRNLGVIFDSKLTFGNHVQLVTSKINSAFYQLYNLCRYMDEPLRKLLVNALIFPHIFYCQAVLQGVGVVLDMQLQRLINRAVRFVSGLPRDAPISAARRSLRWLTISRYRDSAIASIRYQVQLTGNPAYLAELFAVYISTRPLRQALAQQPLVVTNNRADAGLLEKVQGITLDNASVNTAFMREFGKLLHPNNLSFDVQNQDFNGFVYIINLLVQDILKM
ncbi:uncharacterized protein LOC107042420 [Diachasma alloeum]|uniref:uncharacterized protein LOC107042420 n=1 Tax=Diachasma alloeum TaxID=454923 RepID=UPI00073845D6|nr:uncharacterized protein LOC107042420 [Diachasma alloeum]